MVLKIDEKTIKISTTSTKRRLKQDVTVEDINVSRLSAIVVIMPASDASR